MRGYAHPSFSSTLLDSIYRSIDDDEPSNLTRGAPDSRKKQQTDYYNSKWGPQTAVTRPRPHPHLRSAAAATSSSSSDSSYGGFSSSSSEVDPVRLKPIRTTDKIRPANNPFHPPPPPAPKSKKEKAKKNLSSIRSKLRSPASPAARLAGFLNSLFTHHHHKPRSGEESASSTASSFSRSCMSTKTTSAAGGCNGAERSVTFRLPADGGGGGRKARERKAAEEERERVRVMTWRGFEEVEDDVGSESSSDLFELENLSVIGRYRDELPVYESTNLGRLVL